MADPEIYGEGDTATVVPGEAAPVEAALAEVEAPGVRAAEPAEPADEPAGASAGTSPRRMPLALSVVLGDLGIAVVALFLLIVIGLQRWGDASESAQSHAYVEDLIVIFLVASVFTLSAVLLRRSMRTSVAAMQIVVVAAVLVFGGIVAFEGRPSANPTTTVPSDPTEAPTLVQQ